MKTDGRTIITCVNNTCIYLLLLNCILCFDAIKSFEDFKFFRVKRQDSGDQFPCKNGQFIDSSLVCDGIANCGDSSDESAEQCRDIRCPSYGFRCGYGACIDSALKCNGKVDCADKSDESLATCPSGVIYANTVCNDTQFQCINEQCIEDELQCDGKRDCNDGSDETFNRCHNTPCDTNRFFRCNYGACVDKSFKCDGKPQCADGSDELPKICNKTPAKPVTPKPKPETTPPPVLEEGACVAPSTSPDKTVTYTKSGKPYTGNTRVIPPYVRATFQCTQGYHRVEGNKFFSICDEGVWVPEVPRCEKICDKLTPINVDLTCYRNNATIDCAGPLISGTRIHPVCKQLHTYRDFVPVYQEMVCQEDGKWDNILFSCVPECGRPYSGAVTLIIQGTPEKYGDSPWHVAIYNIKTNLLICGGTIIHPYLILSAAHCFYDKNKNKKLDPDTYEIVVGKYTRDYSKKDNEYQKAFKIKEIRFSNRGYVGLANYFAADIALLILEEKISVTPTVLPACVDWIHTEKYHPPEGTPGKVVGWGMNELGKYSENLLTANLPFMSNAKCFNSVPLDFRPFITYDKFCAGSDGGPGVLQGDSGGGLLFREGAFYYVRGIVSLKQPTATSVAAFTDVADHINWILSVRNEIEQEAIKKETTLGSKG